MAALPIEPLVPEIAESLRVSPNLVLEAPPGAGKTTRVPPALLEVIPGEIWVLEPRRLAARLAARRVASELGERLGESVGYQVRFEEVAGPRTRLRFLTEGVLTRKMLSNPTLDGVGVVVLDEFHERHLEGDFALALLRRLQQHGRPDLRVVVMSATLDAGPVSDYLGRCPMLKSEGRLFELAIDYSPVSPEPLETVISKAVSRVLRQQDAGDILVFLPGAAEIRKAERACQPIARRAGLLITAYLGWIRLTTPQAIGDRPLLLLGILLIFTGVQLVTLGLLAEMQARTYHESQNKPIYVIREVRDDVGSEQDRVARR